MNTINLNLYVAKNLYKDETYDLAIEAFQQCLAIQQTADDNWECYFYIGLAKRHLGNRDGAVHSWLCAYNECPLKVENLCEIIKLYRQTAKFHTAFVFYKMVQNMVEDTTDSTILGFLAEEFSVISFYLGHRRIAKTFLTMFNNRPISGMAHGIRNMKHYHWTLETKSIGRYNFNESVTLRIGDIDVPFKSSSCCIIKHPFKEGYVMNVRYVNYVITPGGNYVPSLIECIVTTNKMVILDKSFQICESKFFDVDLKYGNVKDSQILGHEDIRIFKDNCSDNLRFIGTGPHTTQKYLGIIMGDYDISDGIGLSATDVKCSFNKAQVEKNWTFVNIGSERHVIYSWYPLTICKVDSENNLAKVREITMPSVFSHARGSTCASFNSDENWFIVHYVAYDCPRVYYHMFVVFNADMTKLLRYSIHFQFEEGSSIEYCLGLVVEDDRIICSYSVHDQTSSIVVLDRPDFDENVEFILNII